MLDRWSSVRSILASSARSIVYRMPFSGELQILTRSQSTSRQQNGIEPPIRFTTRAAQ
jgi:hypothetical protein